MKVDTRPINIAFELGLLILLASFWGSSYLFIKVALETIPPVTLIAVRVSIAAFFLLLVIRLKKEKLPRDARSWRLLLIQSFLNSIGAWTLLAWGQQYVDSAQASVLNSTSPIFVFFITFFLTRHEPTTILKFLGASLGVLGVVFIVGADVMKGLGQQGVAQFAVLFSAFLYGSAAVFAKKLSYLSASVTAASTMVWAAVWLVPISLVLDQPWTLAPSVASIGATLMLSVFGTGIALILYFRLIGTLGSLGVASQSYLRSGIGVLLGVFILGEEITIVVGLGLATVILGVALINYPKKQITNSQA